MSSVSIHRNAPRKMRHAFVRSETVPVLLEVLVHRYWFVRSLLKFNRVPRALVRYDMCVNRF